MSVNRDMRSYGLFKKERARSPSGATREAWHKERDINVAVYKTDDRLMSGNERYNQITHTGQTYYKEMKAGTYQIRRDGRIFDVIGFNPDGRLSVMSLKEVDSDAG